jgi:hypothetical protein
MGTADQDQPSSTTATAAASSDPTADRKLLVAVYEALTVPRPAIVDDPAYCQALAERVRQVRLTLEPMVTGQPSMPIDWEIAELRRRVASSCQPTTAYEHAPTDPAAASDQPRGR